MFSNLIYFWRKFIDFCTSNTICKDNTAINFITFNTKRSIPVNFNGSWARFVCKLHYFLTQRDPFPLTLTGHELGLYVSCITFNTKRSIPVNFNGSWARFVCKLHLDTKKNIQFCTCIIITCERDKVAGPYPYQISIKTNEVNAAVKHAHNFYDYLHIIAVNWTERT
jgi:hypothetical protein